MSFPTDDKNPECNIDHGSMVDDEKSTPDKELIEYFVQFRSDELETLDITQLFNIDIDENPILQIILEETKDEFRNVVRDAVTMAHIVLKHDRTDLGRIWANKLKTLRNKIKINIESPTNVRINDLTASDFEGEVVIFDAQISNWSKVRTITYRAEFKCPECDRIIDRTYSSKTKYKCDECKINMEYHRATKSEDTRRITLREITDDFSKKLPFSIPADVYGKSVWESELGDKVTVIGIFRSVPLSKEYGKISQEFIPTIQIISIQNKNHDIAKLPSMKLIKKFKDLEDKGELVKAVIDGFAYNIYKKRMEKKALLCALIGSKWIGQVGKGNPPMIHILFVGDPDTYKSTLMKYIVNVSDNCVLADSTTVSNAGIKAIAIKMDDGRWSIMPGLLPLYNGGLVFLDEFGDLKEDIYADLKAPMIDGKVSKHVAGEDFNGVAETGILASMNPIDGVYDDSKTIYDNLIKLPKPVITRFDLIVKFSKQANDYNSEEIRAHFKKCDLYGKPKNLLTDQEIKSFINYVKNIDPKLTEEAMDYSSKFFNDLELRGAEKSGTATRTENAVMKFAVAIARWHMSNEVKATHVRESLDLYEEGLGTFNLSLKEGEGITTESLKSTTDGRRTAIQKAYDLIKNEDGYVFLDELVTKAFSYGCFKSENGVKSLIHTLELEGKTNERDKMLHINWN